MMSALAACGDEGGRLERTDVTDLPPGDAVGTAASGAYDVELYTSACTGDCRANRAGFDVSLCDVGEVDYPWITATQTDGALTLDADGLIVDRMTGGIFADGHFEVGTWATRDGGTVDVMVLATGSLHEGGFTGTARARSVGAGFDCSATYQLTGDRAR